MNTCLFDERSRLKKHAVHCGMLRLDALMSAAQFMACFARQDPPGTLTAVDLQIDLHHACSMTTCFCQPRCYAGAVPAHLTSAPFAHSTSKAALQQSTTSGVASLNHSQNTPTFLPCRGCTSLPSARLGGRQTGAAGPKCCSPAPAAPTGSGSALAICTGVVLHNELQQQHKD